MNSSKLSIGIVGFGSFGSFIASLLPEDIELSWFDIAGGNPLHVVAQSDVVVLAVPFAAYERVLPQLAAVLAPETLLVDACSVKAEPSRLIDKYFPNHGELLLTHPLFGPQSADNGLRGLQLIVTRKRGKKADRALALCEGQGLEIEEMTAEEHDKVMATVHALTFFIGRGLADMHLEKGAFVPPSFSSLLRLVELDAAHSEELFQTIETANPYAAGIRKQFLERMKDVDRSLRS